MKKTIAMLLSVLVLLALCGCGKEDTPSETPAAEIPVEEAAQEVISEDFEPVTFKFDESTVTVVGAEEFTDAEDEPAVRFYYDYTNNSDEPTSAWWSLNFTAEQNGVELASTYANAEDDVAEYGNSSLDVYPGVTIRCIEEFSYDPEEGGILAFFVDDYTDEYSVELNADVLPGRPSGSLTLTPVTDPVLTADLPAGIDDGSGYAISVDTAEVVEGWDDAPVVRVYFNYTNNTDSAVSCWSALSVSAFQDGVELETQWAAEKTDADNAFKEEIAPGETISCSACWELRSDSPVEVCVCDNATGTEIGACFPIA